MAFGDLFRPKWKYSETRVLGFAPRIFGASLSLLRHKLRRLCLADRVQHGQRERRRAIAIMSRRRMVAIELGM